MGPTLTILDVGHGNAAVLEDESEVVVFDAGSGSSLLEYLSGQQIGHVDTVLVSHADADHIDGLVALIASRTVSIGRVFLNSDAEKKSKIWASLASELESLADGGKIELNVGISRNAGYSFSTANVAIEVLAPGARIALLGVGSTTTSGKRVTSNTISAVFRLSWGTKPVAVLSGDIDHVALEELSRVTGSKAAPVLVFPHHGGRSGAASNADFASKICETFEPSTVLFSLGRGKHGTPRPDVVAAIRRASPDVRLACTQLSLSCATSTPPAEPGHLLAIYAQGRASRHCCAGSFRITVDEDTTVAPSMIVHTSFINANAPGALCLR